MAVPLDQLLERLSHEADEQRAGVRRTAEQEADRLIRQAEATAEKELAARLQVRELVLRAESRGMLERVRQQSFRVLLERRHAAVDAILARVAALLPAAAGDPRYVSGLAGELEEAFRLLAGLGGVLRITPALSEIALSLAPAGVEVRSEASVSGFVLESSDGRVTIDGTLTERFRRLRPSLVIAAARALEQAA